LGVTRVLDYLDDLTGGRYYVLDERTGVPIHATVEDWARMFQDGPRRVLAQTSVGWCGRQRGRRRTVEMVSTVFLGLDHNHAGVGPPILWETMIFTGPFDGYQRRYASRSAAAAGHGWAVGLCEQYRQAPRRTRLALRRWAGYQRTRPRDVARVAAVLRRVGADLLVHPPGIF
jgi:hypothetical protein